jgi:hypothetical protein
MYSSAIVQLTAKFLLLFVNDAPVSTVIPPLYIPGILSNLDSLKQRGVFDKTFFDSFCPELSKLLQASISEMDFMSKLVDFLLYLIEFVRGIHVNDPLPPEPSPIPESYNPESGIAYYFSSSGSKLRNVRNYKLSSATNNFDDTPAEEVLCSKKFPSVSFGGWSHLFLWFCPIHGHCYGFHVIDGSEGRKDPFASAYQYMSEAPRELFYDFACSLNEYCLNREPHFFQNTRFWHDVFHSFAHKCGPNFKSQRIPSLQGVDSEICEQFNAYIQCIKFTGTHLTQSHFCFFLQFFIYLWQEKKTFSFEKKLNTALLCMN